MQYYGIQCSNILAEAIEHAMHVCFGNDFNALIESFNVKSISNKILHGRAYQNDALKQIGLTSMFPPVILQEAVNAIESYIGAINNPQLYEQLSALRNFKPSDDKPGDMKKYESERSAYATAMKDDPDMAQFRKYLIDILNKMLDGESDTIYRISGQTAVDDKIVTDMLQMQSDTPSLYVRALDYKDRNICWRISTHYEAGNNWNYRGEPFSGNKEDMSKKMSDDLGKNYNDFFARGTGPHGGKTKADTMLGEDDRARWHVNLTFIGTGMMDENIEGPDNGLREDSPNYEKVRAARIASDPLLKYGSTNKMEDLYARDKNNASKYLIDPVSQMRIPHSTAKNTFGVVNHKVENPTAEDISYLQLCIDLDNDVGFDHIISIAEGTDAYANEYIKSYDLDWSEAGKTYVRHVLAGEIFASWLAGLVNAIVMMEMANNNFSSIADITPKMQSYVKQFLSKHGVLSIFPIEPMNIISQGRVNAASPEKITNQYDPISDKKIGLDVGTKKYVGPDGKIDFTRFDKKPASKNRENYNIKEYTKTVDSLGNKTTYNTNWEYTTGNVATKVSSLSDELINLIRVNADIAALQYTSEQISAAISTLTKTVNNNDAESARVCMATAIKKIFTDSLSSSKFKFNDIEQRRKLLHDCFSKTMLSADIDNIIIMIERMYIAKFPAKIDPGSKGAFADVDERTKEMTKAANDLYPGDLPDSVTSYISSIADPKNSKLPDPVDMKTVRLHYHR